MEGDAPPHPQKSAPNRRPKYLITIRDQFVAISVHNVIYRFFLPQARRVLWTLSRVSDRRCGLVDAGSATDLCSRRFPALTLSCPVLSLSQSRGERLLMQRSPIQGRVSLPAQALDPQEESERESSRSYVRRLLDLEAERARLQVQCCTHT